MDRSEYQREYRRTPQARAKRHAWYVSTYVPRVRQEPEDDPALIEARTQAVLQAKMEKWVLHHTTTALSESQARALRLPGDDN